MPDDAETTAPAPYKQDIPDLLTNYPGLKPLFTTPLQRETVIEPAKSASGTVLFPLKITKPMWDQRKSAVIKVDIYHQPALYLTIPK